MLEKEIARLADAAEKQNELLETVISLMTSQGVVKVTDATPVAKPVSTEKPAKPAKPEKPAKITPSVKDEVEDADDADEESSGKVTASDVKELAKKRMSEGYLRSDLKKKIEELGADNIADLDEDGMIKFYAFLKQMGEDADI